MCAAAVFLAWSYPAQRRLVFGNRAPRPVAAAAAPRPVRFDREPRTVVAGGSPRPARFNSSVPPSDSFAAA
jgi:hypothetical protein